MLQITEHALRGAITSLAVVEQHETDVCLDPRLTVMVGCFTDQLQTRFPATP